MAKYRVTTDKGTFEIETDEPDPPFTGGNAPPGVVNNQFPQWATPGIHSFPPPEELPGKIMGLGSAVGAAMLPEALAAAPVRTALGIGTGVGVRHIMRSAGLPEWLSDAGGLAAGGLAGGEGLQSLGNRMPGRAGQFFRSFRPTPDIPGMVPGNPEDFPFLPGHPEGLGPSAPEGSMTPGNPSDFPFLPGHPEGINPPRPGPVTRAPAWSSLEMVPQGVPGFQSTPQEFLPSGRTVGPLQTASPQVVPPPVSPLRTPVWNNIQVSTPESLPDINPIQGQLPSGRTVGPIQASPQAAPPAVSPLRTPVWNNVSVPTPESLPDVNPIQSQLPSGRVPGQPQAVPPVQGVSEVPKNIEPLSAPQAHKYAHAQATEAELPGSPAGTSKGAHSALTDMARRLYGKNSWHELSAQQMEEIGDRLNGINRGAASRINPVGQ
jgi:hypothetical protein